MDSITHVVLGAIVGEAVAGKKLGKKALFIGAAAQSLPDIDFVASFWLSRADDLLAHRGITHSILFGLLAAVLLGALAARWHGKSGLTTMLWVLFFGLEIAIHLLLDSLNSYGTGWFEPFSHLRVSFNVIYVADPFFSIWPGLAFAALLLIKTNSAARRKWTLLSLAASTVYLCYALLNKTIINREASASLRHQHLLYNHYFTTPTPLNNWLWYVVAEVDSGFHVGYGSVFDRIDSIDFTYFPQRASLLQPAEGDEVKKLIRFSQGYFTIEQGEDGLLFNDLRFGQRAGWSNRFAPFAFRYDLHHPEANLFVVQQGRFSNWNMETVQSMVHRIRGN